MKSSPVSSPLNPYHHIYVEEDIREHPQTLRILSRLPKGQVIPIRHYKDVFCRTRQDVALQHRAQALILARKTGTLIYPGAPVCQSFGNHHFYYTSLCMNCPYDCQYCYLRGMYPSGNLVLFVNLEDYFRELETLLAEHPVYLCLSYDTDLCPLESLHGLIHAFHHFLAIHPTLTVEVRTKSACIPLLRALPPTEQMIFAFTLSPDEITVFERKTPSLGARLQAAKEGIDLGHSIRLCFDPMLYVPGWREVYTQFVPTLTDTLGADHLKKVRDFSVGTFRISQSYLRFLRHTTSSPIVQYPFVNLDGVYGYPPTLAREMEDTLCDALSAFAGPDKIFRWEDN